MSLDVVLRPERVPSDCKGSWSPDEVETLRRLWPISTIQQLVAAIPSRTVSAIRTKGKNLKLARKQPRARALAWSDEELVRLTALFPAAPMPTLLSAFPGRSFRGLESMAAKRGISRRATANPLHGVRFDPNEIARIIDLRPTTTAPEIARQIGRGKNGVWKLTKRLGLAVPSKGPSATRPVRGAGAGALPLYALARAAARVSAEPITQARREAFNGAKLYFEARAAVPANLGPLRDDIISELMLAHLAGTLEVADFPRRAPEFIRAYNRAASSWRLRSLDAVISGTEGLRFSETISTEDYEQRWGRLV